MSSTLSTPSKSTSNSHSISQQNPIDLLSNGLLQEFTSLGDLEVQLEQIVMNQKGLIDVIVNLNTNYMQSEEIMEVQLMMKKLNLYRLKLKKIKSEMLYIRSTSQSLLQKSIAMQNIKVNEKAERVKRMDYEINLVGRSKRGAGSDQ